LGLNGDVADVVGQGKVHPHEQLCEKYYSVLVCA